MTTALKATNCIHTESNYQGVNTPIFTSTANKYRGYDETVYPRYFNSENQKVIVEKLVKLEDGEDGLIFSSGMAAISTALLSQLESGDHVIFTSELYGGSHKLIVEEFKKFGISYDFVSGNDMANIRSKINDNTKVIYTETPSNPLLSVVDLKSIAEIAKENQLITIVDNTFATPINQNPISLGIDVVVHSGTKYLGGHSDLCFGAVVTSKELKKTVMKSALNFGGSLNGLDCYLIERSLKTLAVRVEKQNANAQKLTEYLADHSKVKKVYYPGLQNHPGHKVAKEQMPGGFGGMFAFELKDANQTERFLDQLTLIQPAVSLGGVETIICQPSKTSHVKMPEEERIKLGITDGLLRVSTGIEGPQDLISDLDQALN